MQESRKVCAVRRPTKDSKNDERGYVQVCAKGMCGHVRVCAWGYVRGYVRVCAGYVRNVVFWLQR